MWKSSFEKGAGGKKQRTCQTDAIHVHAICKLINGHVVGQHLKWRQFLLSFTTKRSTRVIVMALFISINVWVFVISRSFTSAVCCFFLWLTQAEMFCQDIKRHHAWFLVFTGGLWLQTILTQTFQLVHWSIYSSKVCVVQCSKKLSADDVEVTWSSCS